MTLTLASGEEEIRVGPSHQARLPDYVGNVMPQDMPEKCEALEDLRWAPGLSDDNDLLMYLSAARSMAAFVSTCDGGSPKDGCFAASRDKTTIIAFDLVSYGFDLISSLNTIKYLILNVMLYPLCPLFSQLNHLNPCLICLLSSTQLSQIFPT